ncbi:unnamed protein product [Amoebophrya sp. A25]|nr:unnamed protein product [Amoebophrya sp. A25]|eukprot:GSA25T00024913001.1
MPRVIPPDDSLPGSPPSERLRRPTTAPSTRPSKNVGGPQTSPARTGIAEGRRRERPDIRAMFRENHVAGGMEIYRPADLIIEKGAFHPDEIRRVFEDETSANLVTVEKEKAARLENVKERDGGKKMPKKLDVDNHDEFIRVQEQRRNALWQEVHTGFSDMVNQFEDFHQVLMGDMEGLGDRLSDKHKRMIQEKLDRENYVKSLEERIKELIEEKKYFQQIMEEQFRLTNYYYNKFKEHEEYKAKCVTLEQAVGKLQMKGRLLQKAVVKWKGKHDDLRKHLDLTLENFEAYFIKDVKKIQRQQILSAWETDVRITKIVDALDDSEKRLVQEREHWMKTVADVRLQLQAEKSVVNHRHKRMRMLGEKALYRLRVLINPGSRPDLEKVCFRHWAKEVLSLNGRIRDLRLKQEAEQENRFLHLYVKELEAFRDDLNPAMWTLYMEAYSRLQDEVTEMTVQLRETRNMAHAEFLAHRNIRLVDEREKWRGRLRELESRMRAAWARDVKEVYEECFYLQQRNVNLEKLANDGVDEQHGKPALYAVVPKDVGIRCIDCTRKVVLQEEKRKVKSPRARSASPVCSPVANKGLKDPKSFEMIPWTTEERLNQADRKRMKEERLAEEEADRLARKRNNDALGGWAQMEILDVPSEFQWDLHEDLDDKPFPFEHPLKEEKKTRRAVKKATDTAKLLRKEFLEQFFEQEQKRLPTLGWNATAASAGAREAAEFTANGGRMGSSSKEAWPEDKEDTSGAIT